VTANPRLLGRRLSSLEALRYVLPLREGGSLPAIIDTDGGQFAVKFHGAGQGPKALAAEVIAWGIAKRLALPVPEAALVALPEGFGAAEPDPEIQDLLRASAGLNFGLRYMSGALGFDPVADRDCIDAEVASAIVWFDALISNVDRTARNPNILVWNEEPWLIDHGAALYFHHGSTDWLSRAKEPFAMIKDHVLIDRATLLREADSELTPLLTEKTIEEAVDAVPDAWLFERPLKEPARDTEAPAPDAVRRAYFEYLLARLDGDRPWVREAARAAGR
jgi:hypothetical protein